MKKIYVILRDAVEYEFDPAKYTQEEAERMALERWNERVPLIWSSIDEEDE